MPHVSVDAISLITVSGFVHCFPVFLVPTFQLFDCFGILSFCICFPYSHFVRGILPRGQRLQRSSNILSSRCSKNCFLFCLFQISFNINLSLCLWEYVLPSVLLFNSDSYLIVELLLRSSIPSCQSNSSIWFVSLYFGG